MQQLFSYFFFAACICDEFGTDHCNHESGECVCRRNVIGEKCDRCEVEHYGFESGGGCVPCQCGVASYSTQCDDVTGQCRCKPGVTGRTCDTCAPGYWNYTSDGCICKEFILLTRNNLFINVLQANFSSIFNSSVWKVLVSWQKRILMRKYSIIMRRCLQWKCPETYFHDFKLMREKLVVYKLKNCHLFVVFIAHTLDTI